MIQGEGFGKVILFGEHFVVHGLPAIALGLSNKSIIRIEESKENEIITKFPVIQTLSISAIQAVEDAVGVKEKFKVYFEGDLPVTGGLGSSAAFCVALAKALSKKYSKNFNNEEINKIANEGEKVFHGNPSGIDSAVATYGGAIEYKRNQGFKQIKIGKPIFLVVGITGKNSPTKIMIEKVQEFKNKNSEEFEKIKNEYQEIFEEGKNAIEEGKIEIIGELMNKNQKLLKKVGVSDEINDKLIEKFLQLGAIGAKLTGGGGGGCCIALAENEEKAKEILEKIYPFKGFVTKVD
ncbi:MAG: mevalonate kinase [Candidatus ainarchaeum sp.]|nr:mevalonate kinase [Candidatus ainarchaeum sp.]